MLIFISLLVVQFITFLGIVFFLKFLFSGQLKNAQDRLNTLHEENLAKEEELKEELKRAKEESQAEIQRGKDEAESIIEEANKEIQRLRLNLEEQAKQQAEKIIANANLDAEKLKANAIKDIQAQSVELACKIIAELLTETDKVTLQYVFTNGIIQEIAQLPREHFNVEGNPVIKVSVSFPLLDRQRDEIKKILEEKTGKQLELSQSIDPKLIGGLVLDLNGMIIDGTLKNRLQRIISQLK